MREKRVTMAFVLLYYKALEETMECVESLQRLSKSKCDINIVIVDNHSDDGSYEKLKKYYGNATDIYFLETEKNLGFARGNNVGIKFAKEKLHCDFVVAINTDTVIKQVDFCERILLIYESEHFYVMGPKVIGFYDDELQSPIGIIDENKIYKVVLSNFLHLLAWKTNAIQIIRKFRTPNNDIKKGKYSYDKCNCICSGACLIFSSDFLNKWDGFYSGTFLYREERILFYIMHQLSCKTLYCDQIEIYHKGGASTDIEFGGNERSKAIAFYKNRGKSLKKELRIRRLPLEKLGELLKFET